MINPYCCTVSQTTMNWPKLSVSWSFSSSSYVSESCTIDRLHIEMTIHFNQSVSFDNVIFSSKIFISFVWYGRAVILSINIGEGQWGSSIFLGETLANFQSLLVFMWLWITEVKRNLGNDLRLRKQDPFMFFSLTKRWFYNVPTIGKNYISIRVS